MAEVREDQGRRDNKGGCDERGASPEDSMIFLTSAAEARQALGLDAPDKLLALADDVKC
jgi:hypothetical protein